MEKLGKYLTLTDFCTCTQTYRRLSSQIEPFPRNSASLQALSALAENILDPLIDHYGRDHFQLTMGSAPLT